ncbi:MAG: DinB family protein [Acidobacteriia bacterium]|nr:DinB family protein [Terriglobia bacterium]
MTNELTSFHSRHLRRALSVVESSIAGMADDQMTWAPEGKWSSANLLEHLSLGFMITAKGCRMILRQGGPELPRPTLHQRWLAFRVLVLGYFPMRVIAPKMVCPRGLGPEDAKRSLLENLAEMDRMMWECEEKFGSKIEMLSHPYLGPLTIKQWRKFQLFHVRRHMKQLYALRQQMIQASRENSEATARPSPA